MKLSQIWVDLLSPISDRTIRLELLALLVK